MSNSEFPWVRQVNAMAAPDGDRDLAIQRVCERAYSAGYRDALAAIDQRVKALKEDSELEARIYEARRQAQKRAGNST